MWTQLNGYVVSLYTRLRLQTEREEGQALVEYTLILALISVVAIGALTTIGTDIRTDLNNIVTSLAAAA